MKIVERFRSAILVTTTSSVLLLGPALPTQALAAGAGAQRSGDRGASEPGYVCPQVARLELWYGVWRVTERHFNAKGEAVATVKGIERIEWLLERRAIRRDYSTTTDTTVFRAFGVLTWNDVEKRYDGVWFDNVSLAGPASVKGQWDEAHRTMTFMVESLTPDGSTARYKVVERIEDENKRFATTYVIDGDRTIKRMEVEYKRARPCPGKLRPIFDD